MPTGKAILKFDVAKVKDRLDEISEIVANQIADLIVGLAKINVPVDTGSLRDSIRKERGGEGLAWRLIRVRAGGYVTNPRTGQLVNYAAYVENKQPYLAPAVEAVTPEFVMAMKGQLIQAFGSENVSIDQSGNDLTVNVKADLSMTYSELRKLETGLIRVAEGLSRITGNERVDAALQKFQQMIMMVRILQMEFRLLQLSAGPIGWFFFGTSLVSAGFSLSSMMDARAP